MEKKEEFKEFAKTHPELVNHIKDGEMTWQKYYELYDIYGEDENIFNKYLQKEESTNITNIVKNIDVNKIQEHIGTAQKALDIIGELTKKESKTQILSQTNPRPIKNFFKD